MNNKRAKPTMEEAKYVMSASTRIAWDDEDVPCPRCGKVLTHIELGNSGQFVCSDENCIIVGYRGL